VSLLIRRTFSQIPAVLVLCVCVSAKCRSGRIQLFRRGMCCILTAIMGKNEHLIMAVVFVLLNEHDLQLFNGV
jgi:hypothetical protein